MGAVKVDFVCLAGNHSCWAAKQLLLANSAGDSASMTEASSSEQPRIRYNDRELLMREAWLFPWTDLNLDLRFLLQSRLLY